MSSRCPMRLGSPLKNQTCEHGLARSIWPSRSRRTFAWVTSTPHLSQITPRCFMRLYLPQRHSQSATGPKMRAQKRPSRSGLKAVSYTHLRAHETPEHLVCRLLLEKKKKNTNKAQA